MAPRRPQTRIINQTTDASGNVVNNGTPPASAPSNAPLGDVAEAANPFGGPAIGEAAAANAAGGSSQATPGATGSVGSVAPGGVRQLYTPPGQTPPPAGTPLGTQLTDQANQQNAVTILQNFFASVPGLATLDPQGLLSAWAVSQASYFAGKGMSPSDIVNMIETTINNPMTASSGDTELDTATRAVFDTVFPGYNEKIQNGTTNSDGSYTGLAGYIQYSAQIRQFATQAGLVPGTIDQNMIGNLWGGDVSSSEVSQRITDATVYAASAPQPVQDYLAQNYPGMSGPGALASYYLNPTNTLQSIQTNLNTGMVGGAAAAAGFDKDLSSAKASALGAFLANGVSGGNGSQTGTVNPVNFQQATNAFTSGLGSNGAGGSLGSAAQMAAAGYASGNLPGQTGGALNEDTLLASIEGNAGALALTQQAEQARTAGSKGGGGFATSAKGAASLGYASEG